MRAAALRRMFSLPHYGFELVSGRRTEATRTEATVLG